MGGGELAGYLYAVRRVFMTGGLVCYSNDMCTVRQLGGSLRRVETSEQRKAAALELTSMLERPRNSEMRGVCLDGSLVDDRSFLPMSSAARRLVTRGWTRRIDCTVIASYVSELPSPVLSSATLVLCQYTADPQERSFLFQQWFSRFYPTIDLFTRELERYGSNHGALVYWNSRWKIDGFEERVFRTPTAAAAPPHVWKSLLMEGTPVPAHMSYLMGADPHGFNPRSDEGRHFWLRVWHFGHSRDRLASILPAEWFAWYSCLTDVVRHHLGPHVPSITFAYM